MADPAAHAASDSLAPTGRGARGRSLTRRRFLTAAGSALAFGTAAAAYARFVEPHRLRVVQQRIPLGRPGAPLRIAHLSDLHYSRIVPLADITAAVRLTIAARPDLILLTGDYVTAPDRSDLHLLAGALAPLAAAAPTFATFGNHDGGRFSVEMGGFLHPGPLRSALTPAGLVFLENTRATVELRGRRVHVVGVGDLWNRTCLPEVAFADFAAAPADTVIALSHNPDSRPLLRPHRWDLLLCGHTHGGQVGLPGLAQWLAPVRDTSHIVGLARYEGRPVFITRGVGSLHGVRFLCPPEVAILDLV